MSRLNRNEYLRKNGWRKDSGSGSHSYWIRPDSHKPRKPGRIYMRSVAVQIQRGEDWMEVQRMRLELELERGGTHAE
jgi:hypothetical protein